MVFHHYPHEKNAILLHTKKYTKETHGWLYTHIYIYDNVYNYNYTHSGIVYIYKYIIYIYTSYIYILHIYIYTPLYWHWYPINMSTWPRGEFSKTRHNSRCVTLATLGMAQVLKYCHLVGGPMVKTMVFPMVNIPNYISGWWFYITILKNDRVRRWEG